MNDEEEDADEDDEEGGSESESVGSMERIRELGSEETHDQAALSAEGGLGASSISTVSARGCRW
jgi:hypothetical protein